MAWYGNERHTIPYHGKERKGKAYHTIPYHGKA
jgi:hypothetical protein